MDRDTRAVVITLVSSLVFAIIMASVMDIIITTRSKSNFYDYATQVSPGFYCLTTNDGHISGNCEIDYAALNKFGDKDPVVLKTFNDNGTLYTQIQYMTSRDSGPLDIPNTTRAAVVKVADLGKALESNNPRREIYDLNDGSIKPDNFAPVKGFDRKTKKPIL